jgi:hypothetical protein
VPARSRRRFRVFSGQFIQRFGGCRELITPFRSGLRFGAAATAAVRLPSTNPTRIGALSEAVVRPSPRSAHLMELCGEAQEINPDNCAFRIERSS